MAKKRTSKRVKRASKRGGRRPGAGRRRAQLPPEVLARIGQPPSGAVAVRVWIARLLGELLVLEMNGRIPASLAASLRATAGAIARIAHGGAYDDDEDDDDFDGPELEDVGDDGIEPVHEGLRIE